MRVEPFPTSGFRPLKTGGAGERDGGGIRLFPHPEFFHSISLRPFFEHV